MDGIRAYIFSLTATAMLCGLLVSLLGEKGTVASIGKMLVGIILVIATVRPLLQIRIDGWNDWLGDISAEAGNAVAIGEQMARDAESDIIKSRVEAYILDKAGDFGTEISVEVFLNSDNPPQITEVRIYGAVSPYVKQRLVQIMERDLNIAKENQIWTG